MQFMAGLSSAVCSLPQPLHRRETRPVSGSSLNRPVPPGPHWSQAGTSGCCSASQRQHTYSYRTSDFDHCCYQTSESEYSGLTPAITDPNGMSEYQTAVALVFISGRVISINIHTCISIDLYGSSNLWALTRLQVFDLDVQLFQKGRYQVRIFYLGPDPFMDKLAHEA